MPARADYMKVAKQIAEYMNGFGLAFKTYQIAQFDEMMKSVAGPGARVSSSDKVAEEFTNALLERGFQIFPAIKDASDGYVRVLRTNTVIANLLSAFRYPGADGDSQLASLLTTLQHRRRPDDFTAPERTE